MGPRQSGLMAIPARAPDERIRNVWWDGLGPSGTGEPAQRDFSAHSQCEIAAESWPTFFNFFVLRLVRPVAPYTSLTLKSPLMPRKTSSLLLPAVSGMVVPPMFRAAT